MKKISTKIITTAAAVGLLFSMAAVATATHVWGGYHWARTANPFTLKLGDNMSSAWDPYLAEASADWTQSSVMDTTIVPGSTTPKLCRATNGRVEVCNSKYGFNGWLGIASVWVSGSHITKATVKMNDSYFNTATYNKPAWRRLVTCQEIGHTFGLNHQDENFNNPNLGTCMDYTSDPDGPPSNEHPNAHDYEQLELLYAHVDGTNTIGQLGLTGLKQAVDQGIDLDSFIAAKKGSRLSVLEQKLENGEKVVNFIIWAEAN